MFYCDGSRIRTINPAMIRGAVLVETWSVYVNRRRNYPARYHTINYDAVNPSNGWMGWSPLQYSHKNNGVSFACPTGDRESPSRGNASQRAWYTLLGLPEPSHGFADGQHCGLNGWLGILLALIYLSVDPERIEDFLTRRMWGGHWNWPAGQEVADRDPGPRGVRVNIWAPSAQVQHVTNREKQESPLFH